MPCQDLFESLGVSLPVSPPALPNENDDNMGNVGELTTPMRPRARGVEAPMVMERQTASMDQQRLKHVKGNLCMREGQRLKHVKGNLCMRLKHVKDND